jgi:hypothetical protein
MARLKKGTIETRLDGDLGYASLDVTYHVNSEGEFYCELPEQIRAFFSENHLYNNSIVCKKNRAGNMAIYATTLVAIEDILSEALREVNKPTITTEHVIRYNIESHVSFAETSLGEVVPNAGYPDAQWRQDKSMFGNHHASNQSSNGYSLCVGAIAMTKTTTVIGNKKSIRYKKYYKGKSHLGHENAAQKLNSWVSFTLPKQCKEIPYTDESAMWFYNLMLGMATISKQIQEATFEQENLLSLIESGNAPLFALPNKPSS